ncbi:MAG: ABC transporter ATP-binding protein [Anaerolineaceae bacterium]|nr:ABC transporter ATP-binding protein [Anaerolineaceae bacterium]
MRSLNKYIYPYRFFIALTLAIKLGGAVAELFVPYFMERILREGTMPEQKELIYIYGALMFLCAGLCLLMNVTANRMSARSSGKIIRKIRYDLFEKLNSLSSRQMDKLTIPSAESRLTSDTYRVNEFLARGQRLGIRAPSLLIGGVIMMITMDFRLALVPLSLLPIIALSVWLITRKSIPLYTKEQSVLDDLVRVVQENVTGVRVIRALSKADYEQDRFTRVNDRLTHIDTAAGAISALNNPISSLVLNLGLTAVVVVGGMQVAGGISQPSVIVAFLQYFVMILNALLGVTRIFILGSRFTASAQRIGDVLELPADHVIIPVKEAAEAEEAVPHIEFRDVSFSYNGIGENISGLSFKLFRGQTLGILGTTGSGKSTIIRLLMRFYDPDQGEILIDGKDIRSFKKDELSSRFGAVFQNDFVMEGTVRENIRFFRQIGEAAAESAARDAQASEFIEEKEGGMEAPVTIRGSNLSGGQRQRLLIARALAGDPDILILDDASSALDYRTDALLRHALRTNHAHTTTVLIAQRISSLLHADLILVLDDGKVIGAGKHEELLAGCPEYRIIAETQMGAGEEAGI